MNILFFFSMILIINYLFCIILYNIIEKEYLLSNKRLQMASKAISDLENGYCPRTNIKVD